MAKYDLFCLNKCIINSDKENRLIKYVSSILGSAPFYVLCHLSIGMKYYFMIQFFKIHLLISLNNINGFMTKCSERPEKASIKVWFHTHGENQEISKILSTFNNQWLKKIKTIWILSPFSKCIVIVLLNQPLSKRKEWSHF